MKTFFESFVFRRVRQIVAIFYVQMLFSQSFVAFARSNKRNPDWNMNRLYDN